VTCFEGLATSFFNDKNRSLVRDLTELLIESKQDVPQWLETLAAEGRYSAAQRKTPTRRCVEIFTDCLDMPLICFFVLLDTNLFSAV